MSFNNADLSTRENQSLPLWWHTELLLYIFLYACGLKRREWIEDMSRLDHDDGVESLPCHLDRYFNLTKKVWCEKEEDLIVLILKGKRNATHLLASQHVFSSW